MEKLSVVRNAARAIPISTHLIGTNEYVWMEKLTAVRNAVRACPRILT